MEIETFEIEEVTSDMTGEEDGVALAMIERLGLDGQAKLCGGEENKALCPYRKMTKEESRVYKLLFPQDQNVEKYSDSRIPVRVLQVVEHAKSLEVFDYVHVWSHENADDPAPVLVGYVGQYHFSPDQMFILARWGNCLAPFEELRKKASAKLRDMYIASCKKALSQINAAIESAKSMTENEFFASRENNQLPVVQHE